MTAIERMTQALETWRAAPIHTALLAVVLGCTACGGGGGGGETPALVPLVDSPAKLQASQPGSLLVYVQGKLNQQLDRGLPEQPQGVSVVASVATSASTDALSVSRTTLQEAGVDEADLMKTDGKRIFSMTAGTSYGPLSQLRVDRRQSDGSLVAEGTLALADDSRMQGLHLAADGEQLALVGRTEQWMHAVDVMPIVAFDATLTTDSTTTIAPFSAWTPPQTVIDLVSTPPGQAPTKTRSVRIDGDLVESRMVGNTLYVVTRWFPQINAVQAYGTGTAEQRKAAIGQLSNSDILPRLSITSAGDKTAPVGTALLTDTDCYLQGSNASTDIQMTTVTAFNLASATLDHASRCFMGGTEALYMSANNLYLATTRYNYANSGGIITYSGETSTDIHKFAIDGMQINYRGSGEVRGHLGWDASKSAYRMGEYQNDMRVLTYTQQTGWFGTLDAASTTANPSPAVLTVLREDANGTQLKVLSTLPNAQHPEPIGLSGEQVYAVRFLGERAYVVTFLRTDPLYILDLSDPTNPKRLVELKTNGYSDYLYPLGNGLLLGVGKDANDKGQVQGIKVSLFDVSNGANPKELATRVIGNAGSTSGLDYGSHGINLLTTGNTTRVALPIVVSETPAPGFSGWYLPSYQGLVRFEVDASGKTLSDKSTLIGQSFSKDPAISYTNGSNLGLERSVQIDANVYYLNDKGNIQAAVW